MDRQYHKSACTAFTTYKPRSFWTPSYYVQLSRPIVDAILILQPAFALTSLPFPEGFLQPVGPHVLVRGLCRRRAGGSLGRSAASAGPASVVPYGRLPRAAPAHGGR